MRLIADREVCIGAGMCALTAPDVFDQDEREGRVVLLTEVPGPESIEAAEEAVQLCPSGALSVERD
ncbi:ferredoxin [Glycomyces buryatensis]|uniref:Ferredoxin n=1 Tax=Glycomyces buryatensis TaxID=2570927 RepID=A0A4S8QMJ2_9ACTN|nr:ferredoxin [Glycomyces buryatensis]